MGTFWKHLEQALGRGFSDKSFGHRGEQAAEKFLKRLGMIVVSRNYHNHVGEIDLIAIDGKAPKRCVVFVEVKTRQSDAKGLPVEAVDAHKQRQIANTAMVYLRRHGLLESAYRFDVVSVMWPVTQRVPKIEHYVDAFDSPLKNVLF